jgi:hypothetical protein
LGKPLKNLSPQLVFPFLLLSPVLLQIDLASSYLTALSLRPFRIYSAYQWVQLLYGSAVLSKIWIYFMAEQILDDLGVARCWK